MDPATDRRSFTDSKGRDMKRTGILLAAVILAIGVYLLMTARHGRLTAADFFPDEAILIVEQRELGPLLADFRVSRLGRALAAIDYAKAATDLGMAPEEVQAIDAARGRMEDFFNSQVFAEFFAKEFAVAVLPVADAAITDPDRMVASSLLFISRPSHDADLLKLVSALFGRQLDQTSSRHRATTINHYVVDQGLVLSAATAEGLVIAAFDEQLVRAALDRQGGKSAGTKATLADNREYLHLRHEFVDAQFFAYVCVPMLHEQAGRLVAGLDSPEQKELHQAINQWRGWNAMAFGAWKEKDWIRDKGVFLFNRDKQDPLLAAMSSVKPTENGTLAMVPADIIGYYWANALNLTTFWEMIRRDRQAEEEQLEAMERGVRDTTGMEMEQLLALFGSESALLLKEVATNGFIPLPHGALVFKVEKEPELQALLESQLARLDVATRRQEYEGAVIHSLDLSFHPSLRPVYALYRGYLILAGTSELVKEMVDSQQSGGLTGEKSFLRVNEAFHRGLTGASNSMSYLKVDPFLRTIKGLIDWGGALLSLQDPDLARKARVLSDQLVAPLLDGLAMYEVIGGHSLIRDDAMIIESITILAPER